MAGGKGQFGNSFGRTRSENKLLEDEKKKSLIEKLMKKAGNANVQTAASQILENSSVKAEGSPREALPGSRPPYVEARFGGADVPALNRDDSDVSLYPEPWLVRAVEGALGAAANREIRLQLIWPGTIYSVALVHAFATLERFAIGDKRGLRTLLFPTKRTSYASLSKFLLARERLFELSARYFTVTDIPGAAKPIDGRDDQNKDMLLQAVRSAWNNDPTVPAPCIAEVMPHFDWNLEAENWTNYATRYLSRTKRALQRAHKKELWREGDRFTKLGDPASAPDALFGISHLATAKQWKRAISSSALSGEFQPELVLFDLTKAIRWTTERNLIRLIPEVLDAIRVGWKHPVGFLLVTDDPKTYFTLRAHFLEKVDSDRSRVIGEPIVAIGTDYGLAKTPRPLDWSPLPVSNKHFHVDVLDREMAEAATRLWSIGQGDQDLVPQQQLRSASRFLMRLANLPGGYRDYIAWMESSAFADSIRGEMTWNGQVAQLTSSLECGEFGAKADSVRRAMQRGTAIVNSYYEQTPLARRIAKEVAVCFGKQKYRLAILFRSNTDVAVARMFLERYADFPGGASFNAVKERAEFYIHKELAKVLSSDSVPTKIIFVGLPDETLKEILTSERIPADSIVLVDWQRANSVLIGLRALKSVEVYKAYRGRISEFGDEIQRRLGEVPQAIEIEKIDAIRIPRLSLSAAAAEASRRAEGPGGAYKLELEDGSRIVVGQRVYVYDPDDLKPFHLEEIQNVREGDVVFVMSDELKDMFEVALIHAGHGIPRGLNFGEMLRNYHRDVLVNSKRLFGALGTAALAKRVQARMVELRPDFEPCSLSRIRYWLDVHGSAEAQAEDLKPHSTWSKVDFETFARALDIPENLIAIYWLMVAKQRTALQQVGRELADRYAHVLFREEAAAVHFQLNRETMLQLQDEATRNSYRVLKVIPPQQKDIADGDL